MELMHSIGVEYQGIEMDRESTIRTFAFVRLKSP